MRRACIYCRVVFISSPAILTGQAHAALLSLLQFVRVSDGKAIFQGQTWQIPSEWEPLPTSFLYHSHGRNSYGSGKGVLWEWGSHYLRSLKFPSKTWEMVLKCYWCIKVHLRAMQVPFHSITLPMTHLVYHYSLKSRCLWLKYSDLARGCKWSCRKNISEIVKVKTNLPTKNVPRPPMPLASNLTNTNRRS